MWVMTDGTLVPFFFLPFCLPRGASSEIGFELFIKFVGHSDGSVPDVAYSSGFLGFAAIL